MTRVNITVADDLLGRAKAAVLSVSRLAAAALTAELEHRAKIAELDAYLADLVAELGPVSAQEPAAAREWADQVLTDCQITDCQLNSSTIRRAASSSAFFARMKPSKSVRWERMTSS